MKIHPTELFHSGPKRRSHHSTQRYHPLSHATFMMTLFFRCLPGKILKGLCQTELFLRLCSAFPLNHSHKVPASSCSITKSHHLCSTSEILCVTPVSWLIDLKQLKTEEGTQTTLSFSKNCQNSGALLNIRGMLSCPPPVRTTKPPQRTSGSALKRSQTPGSKLFPANQAFPSRPADFGCGFTSSRVSHDGVFPALWMLFRLNSWRRCLVSLTADIL